VELPVECGRDERGDRVPRRFGRPPGVARVAEVLDRWWGRDHRYFRVRTEDGAQVILRLDEERSSWSVAFYAVSDGAGTGDGRERG
jgi:hypothetical protein